MQKVGSLWVDFNEGVQIVKEEDGKEIVLLDWPPSYKPKQALYIRTVSNNDLKRRGFTPVTIADSKDLENVVHTLSIAVPKNHDRPTLFQVKAWGQYGRELLQPVVAEFKGRDARGTIYRHGQNITLDNNSVMTTDESQRFVTLFRDNLGNFMEVAGPWNKFMEGIRHTRKGHYEAIDLRLKDMYNFCH